MGYWTCWMEQMRSIAPKVMHHVSKHHIHHVGVHHVKHVGIKKAIVGAPKVSLVKVCVFTGTIAGLMGEGGVAVYKAFPPSITPNVPVHAPPITHVEPEFGPPIDSGFIPLGGIFNGLLPSGLGSIPQNVDMPPQVENTQAPEPNGLFLMSAGLVLLYIALRIFKKHR